MHIFLGSIQGKLCLYSLQKPQMTLLFHHSFSQMKSYLWKSRKSPESSAEIFEDYPNIFHNSIAKT